VEAQFPAMLNQQVGDLMLFEMRPKVFDRVEFGSIGRESFQPESPGALGQHRLDWLTAVDGRTVPDDESRANVGEVPPGTQRRVAR